MRKRIFLFVITVLGFLLSYNLARGVWDSYRNATRLVESEKNLTAQKQKNQELKDQLALVSSPYFVEKEARDKLGLAKKGETIIVTPTPEKKDENPSSGYENLNNPEKWLKLFFDL